MRSISFTKTVFSAAVSFVLFSAAGHAQQSPGTSGDTIGHPPPLSGPPPLSEPSPVAPSAKPQAAPAATATTKPQVGEPASKGYLGAYGPAGASPKPYSTGPLPQSAEGPGLIVPGDDGISARTVRAVPCGRVARETDGFTTCVGIPDDTARRRRR